MLQSDRYWEVDEHDDIALLHLQVPRWNEEVDDEFLSRQRGRPPPE